MRQIHKMPGPFGDALGSVASLEKQGNKLYAVLKPNSKLLRTVEQGQLLHAACEYIEEFAGTGKAYLTGLALTDNPSSLGTTQIHLSATSSNSVVKKNSFYKKDDQISVLKNKVAKLSSQVESLTIQANALTGESDIKEDGEDIYL
ncbi:GPO family capsid scaffolding protein [Vibrio sp. F74]|uniref:GPO family capsid scaffolding protein n=1 Tax=Vibrio sp. F74 TaxID=700020 RepID=UPI0036F2A0D0